MKQRNILWCLAASTPLMLVTPSALSATVNTQQSSELFKSSKYDTGIDYELTAPTQHPSEKIAEDTINSLWEAVNIKVPFTFSSSPISIASSLQGALEKLYDFLDPILEAYDIEHNNVTEFSNIIPATFNQGYFEVTAYNPYATKDKLSPTIESTSDDYIFKVLIYPEFTPNEPQTVLLKNLERIKIAGTPTSQNVVLAFYTADTDELIDTLYLPARKDNERYGACLTRAKKSSYINYQKQQPYSYAKEPGPNKTKCTLANRAPNCAITNDWMIIKTIDSIWPKTSLNLDFAHSTWNAMTNAERAYYGPQMWENSIIINKHEINDQNPDLQLSLWRNPDRLLRSDNMIIYGNNYYGDFAKNAQIIEYNKQGEKQANLGIHFDKKGQSSYQIYIPKTSQYNISFAFKHLNETTFQVENAVDGEILYSASTGKPLAADQQITSTVPREIDLEQGLLYLTIKSDDIDFYHMLISYAGNREQDREEYLNKQYELIHMEVVGAIDYIERHNNSNDEIQQGINHATFIRDHLIQRRFDELKAMNFALDEPVIVEIQAQINLLNQQITTAQTKLSSNANSYDFVIYGHELISPSERVTIRNREALFRGGNMMRGETAFAGYPVSIPKSGYYKTSYALSCYSGNAGMMVGDASGRTFYSTQLPQTGFSSTTMTSNDAREYFDAGNTQINIYGTNSPFSLQKIKFEYDDNQSSD